MRLTPMRTLLSAMTVVVALSAGAACRGGDEPRDVAEASAPGTAAAAPATASESPSASASGGGEATTTASASGSPSPSASAPSGSSMPPALGVQFHGTWELYYSPSSSAAPNAMFTRHLDQIAKNGATMIRLDIGWSASQPSNATPSLSNVYNKRIALVLDQAAKRGLKVLVTLHQSPSWARPGTGSNVKQYPTNPDSIKPWTTWLARTWGSKVEAWEVWNEPNLAEFTGVSDSSKRAARYVPVLKAAAAGFRAGRAGTTVVFGGPAQTDDVFVRQAYVAGAKPHFDVMAIHPYQGNQTKPPESTDISGKPRMTNFPAVVDAMSDYGDGNKPVWWTEFGFSVHSNANVPKEKVWLLGVPSDDVSGDYLRRSFELARKKYPQVRVGILYTAYRNSGSDSYGHQTGYRLIESNGTVLAQLPILGKYMDGFAGHRALR